MDATKIKALEGILSALDNNLGSEEFATAFEKVVEYVQKTHNLTVQQLDEIRSAVEQALYEVKSQANAEYTAKQRALELTAKARMDTLKAEVDLAIARLDEKMATVKDGDSPDPVKIVKDVLSKITVRDGKNGSPDTPDQIISKVNESKLLIKKERIEGLVDLMRNVMVSAFASVPVTTTNFFKSGALVGRAKNINIIPGSNVTATMSQSGDRMDITLASSGGGVGGFTTLTATGAVDGSNTSFDFTSKPTYIVSDHAWYQENTGWTWSGSTATMTIPPNDDIWGFA